ncbi:stage V sporulation protein AC [Desulfosporosinus hippei]|uniref:Stage V sporulation protein AC n=1 Tax=Desulfosporosinus hippei DSM 8344 TaxID=1121419 RepID=A0A1G7ZFT9_9FIRM|nr:stage V sporulation protein AC [Desulfosporosinus hippei]SDH07509.1 stage V sporulation protein AC [Desulfosporosinus hippei DSM 8344]
MDDQSSPKPAIPVTPEKYQKLTEQYTPKPTVIKNVVLAFIVGGIICSIGQIIINLFISLGLARLEASTAATATMIFIGALLTGLGIYDEIGKFAGAGSIVPVTGFANSIVSPAMEFRREGYVMGVGAKLFTVAGPVLVYGIATSIVVGFAYYLLH